MNFVPTLRGVEGPPKMPAEVVKVLEDAFRKASKEQGFVDIAKKRKMVLTDIGSKEFGKAVENAYPSIAKFQNLLSGK